MTKTGGISLASLDARAASEQAFEFEYIDPDGAPSGIWLQVFGQHSASVQAAINRLTNGQRTKDAIRLQQARPGAPPPISPIEDDITFVERAAAVRLAGWRGPGDTDGLDAEQKARFQGISDEFNEDNALRLCKINPHLRTQVLDRSNELANFMKASPASS